MKKRTPKSKSVVLVGGPHHGLRCTVLGGNRIIAKRSASMTVLYEDHYLIQYPYDKPKRGYVYRATFERSDEIRA